MAAGRKQKKREPAREPERDAAEYYRLKTKAVEDLVTADESNSPPVPEEELNKYRGRRRVRLPQWLRVALIKAWFYGAVCFFFFWGLGGYVADKLDLFFVTAIAAGMVTDLLINTLLRYYAKTDGANDRWMMIPRRGVAGFFLNILYAFPVLGLVAGIYTVINLLLLSLTGQTDAVPLGVGPILFGLFYMGIDSGFIALKHLLGRIVADAKKQASEAGATRSRKGTEK